MHKTIHRGHPLFKDVLEDVFKSTIVGFKNGVLCAHVEGPLLANCILEAAVCKTCNRLVKRENKQFMIAVGFISCKGRGVNNLALVKMKVIYDDL